MRARSALGRVVVLVAWVAAPASATEERSSPSTAHRTGHAHPEVRHEEEPTAGYETPALPEGMSLDDVLERAAEPPPDHFPDPVPDDELRMFALFEQVEYRIRDGGPDRLGWEAQGWIGYDFDRLWWKSEGEAVFEGSDEGETENDLLYSRLITPFWNAQLGVQYANAWAPGDYADRWSGVVALQGLAPGMVEIDASLYVSQEADVTAEIEGEYNFRLTQRLVLQPRAELGFSAQDVRARGLGAGLTDVDLDLRLRYEVKREFAPYLGIRYRRLVGETADLARDEGVDADRLFFLGGLRLAF